MSAAELAAIVIVLTVVTAVVALVGAGVGYLYGRVARVTADESVARDANVLSLGSAGVVAIGGVAFLPEVIAGAALVPSRIVVVGPLTALVGGVAAGVVGAATISGVIAATGTLPGVEDARTARRQYVRYLTGLFGVVLLLPPVIEPAVNAGPHGIVAVVAAVGVGLWVCEPHLRSLTASTRPPTDAERARLESVRDAAALEPSRVRILEGGDRFVSVELLGPPKGRVLFVSTGALAALDDERLTAMLVARREQASQYESLGSIVVLVVAAVPVAAWAADLLPAAVGIGSAILVALGGFAVVRRLRYRADARAADAVGSDALVDALERARGTAGIDAEGAGTRRWVSMTPPTANRIERLRTEVDATERSE